MGKDYYKILGVSRDATENDLRKAYRKLAMKWHPDKHTQQNKEKADQMFKDIAEAYDVLSDKEKRQIYDEFGEEGLKGGSGSGGAPFGATYHYSGVDPSEIFSQFFRTERGGHPGGMSFFFSGDDHFPFGGHPFGKAQGFPGMQRSMGRGSSSQVQQVAPKKYTIDLNLTLEELYCGVTKRLKVTRSRWDGNTMRKDDKILEVAVKPGWKDGTKITFNGEGDQETAQSIPGDVVFVVKSKQHQNFVRDGQHLLHKVRVSLSKALIGFILPIKTLDNRMLHVRVEEIVGPQTRKIVPSEGMPNQKHQGERGDLILEFLIEFPKKLTDEQKRAISDILQGTS